MTTKRKRWSFPFLNEGLGAVLLKGDIYEFVRISGLRLIGKVIGKPSEREITIQNEDGKSTFQVHRTDRVKNITPSHKSGGNKKKK